MFGELTLKISECPSSKYKNQNVLNSDLNVPEFDLFRALINSKENGKHNMKTWKDWAKNSLLLE